MILKTEALTQKQVENLHEATLTILENYGFILHHEKGKEIFKSHGATVDGDRVKIPRKLVEMALKTAPETFTFSARNPKNTINIGKGNKTMFGPSAGVVYISDYERGRVSAKLEDLRNFLKLTQTSDFCNISCAGLLYPSDIDPQKGLYMQMLQAIKLSDKPLLGLTQDENVSENTINMARIATDACGEHYVMGIVNSLSPLAWDEKMAGSIIKFAEMNQPLVIACCSMAGFTSPIRLIETVLSNNVEIVAGIVLAQLVNPGTPVVYGNTSGVSDMHTMALSIGAPEYAMISTATCQMSRFYKIPFRSGGGLTDAKDVDMQAGIESSTNLLCSFANKIDVMFHTLGILESFLCISYEKWIMDEEICSRLTRITKDIGDLTEDSINIVGNIGENESYIEHPTTMQFFRTEFLKPLVSDRFNYETWRSRELSTKKLAYKAWNKRIDSYEEPTLSTEIENNLNKFMKNLI